MLPVVHNLINVIRRRQDNRDLILHRRILRDHSNPFDIPNERFIELYRLNKEAARFLFETINPHLEDGTYRNSIPNVIKVFAALRFYATGAYQRDIGLSYIISLSQTSIHRCIQQISHAIEQVLAPQEIKFPTQPEQNLIKENFMRRFGFPGIIGVIDGTQVPVLKPINEAHNFFNRKGYYSLNVQIICNDNLKILSIYANFPGANHDSFIWRQSMIRNFLIQELMANRLRGSWLIGDSGYMLEPFLMTPFLDPPENSPESRYNSHHIRARNCVERCIGVWKCRFRVLLRERTARYAPEFVGTLVNTCASLHNLCLRFRVPLLADPPVAEEDAFIQPNYDARYQNVQREGINVRNNIVNRYFR